MPQKRSGSSTQKNKKVDRAKVTKVVALATLGVVSLGVAGAAVWKSGTSDAKIAAPTPAAVSVTPTTPAPTSAPAAAPLAATGMQDQLRALIAGTDDITISVLGDSTGDASNEWVSLWSQHLAEFGTVTMYNWNKDTNDWNAQPKIFRGNARQITVWNGSMPGVAYTYPLERLQTIQPEKPTFTIVSLGHNIAQKPADVGAAELLAAVDAKWGAKIPAAVTLQNPAQGTREQPTAKSVAALAAWLPGSGYATIDVNTAFTKAGDLTALLADEVHPNPQGSQIWADAVIATLG